MLSLLECENAFTLLFPYSHALTVMCPKDDDPITINQNYRSILMIISGSLALNNDVGLEFNGLVAFFSIDDDATAEECSKSLSYHGPFGEVLCIIDWISPFTRHYYLTFYSWPLHPKENNIFVHNGNPSTTDFHCDMSVAPFSTSCSFYDITTEYIRGMYILNASVFHGILI
jgi:hypothetical protein